MMKKIFEVPTIERIEFRLSDKTMCNDNVTSGVSTDYGVISNMTESNSTSMTEK